MFMYVQLRHSRQYFDTSDSVVTANIVCVVSKCLLLLILSVCLNDPFSYPSRLGLVLWWSCRELWDSWHEIL